MKNKEKSYTVQLAVGFILAMFGIVLVTAGFVCPPLGQIEPSILTALGEIFTFSGACLGIDSNYKIKTMRILNEKQAEDEKAEEGQG